MDDDYIQSILAESGSKVYPEDFLKEFEPLECLSHNDTDTTLLVRNKKTGKHFVTKCYTDKTILSHVTEADILKKLQHPGLPRFAGKYENEHMLCVVRKFVEGVPLDRYVAQNALSEMQAISFTTDLCDILSYLHRQTPPVIHRDIKPQNLIVDNSGRIKLIDFGISRVYDESAAEDTVCYGTKHFAAPEQYGFAQTDIRTDIFSLGVLLGWLLTGESDLKSILLKINNRRLLRIVKRCTAFAPDMRYKSAERVKKALLNTDGHRQKRALCWICGFLACVGCLCLGFVLGRYTDITPTFTSSSGVTFEEPLIEQAVRLALNKDANEPIEETDLLRVTELYICGDKAIGSNEAFEEQISHFANNDGTVKNGGLASLNDLAKFKNLKIIHITLEDITDLTPLSSLEALEYIDLRHNPIEDVSPLASLPVLNNLCLFETRVSDLSPLSSCMMLECVEVGKTQITSMAAFEGIESIKDLYMTDMPLETLSGIEAFSGLEKISLSNVADGDLSPLLNLPQLKEVHLDETLQHAAEDQLKEVEFNIIYS